MGSLKASKGSKNCLSANECIKRDCQCLKGPTKVKVKKQQGSEQYNIVGSARRRSQSIRRGETKTLMNVCLLHTLVTETSIRLSRINGLMI